jgi:hypothetical protein
MLTKMFVFVFSLLISTLIFGIWIEYRVGYILYRRDYTGKTIFQLKPFIRSYLFGPLFIKALWNPYMLDINSFVIIGGLIVIFYFIFGFFL